MKTQRSCWPSFLVALLSVGVAGVSSQAGAVQIPAFFGWNYVEGQALATELAPPPAVMDLTSFTYTGGAGAGLVMGLPAFNGFAGMPDRTGLVFAPTFTTAPGGDGETTRTPGVLLNIDWVAANTNAAYLPAGGVPFPTIGITSFSTTFGNYGFGSPYVVGLIENANPPLVPNQELVSNLQAPRGDIYFNLAGDPNGNPIMAAVNAIGPYDAKVIFAAAVPEPAEFALLSAGLAVVVWAAGIRRRRERA
jgi:hypothetical protein